MKRTTVIAVSLLLFLSCDPSTKETKNVLMTAPEGVDSANSAVESKESQDISGSKTSKENIEKEIDSFVNDQLLPGVKLENMYEVEKLKKALGPFSATFSEPANINYEGMKGDHINGYRYKDFDLVFYVVENNREIFAYLELHDSIDNPAGKIGESIESIKNRFGGELRKRSDKLYTIAVGGRNFLSGVNIVVKNQTVEKILIVLGEI